MTPSVASRPSGERDRTVTRILIADDHDVVRAGLRSVLQDRTDWQVVAEAADGREAVDKAVASKPDVAIVDYSLPLMNGVDVTRQIRLRVPRVEVLMFTVHDSETLIAEALQAGARAYLLKSEAQNHLIAAVAALAGHKPFFTGAMSERLLETFLAAQTHPNGPLLSARERMVVKLIAEGHSNKAMSSILSLSIKTIETHRAAAMRKLHVTSTAALVRYAIRNNLVEP
jgi:DNA-binding NarL/FixJ family response regulator